MTLKQQFEAHEGSKYVNPYAAEYVAELKATIERLTEQLKRDEWYRTYKPHALEDYRLAIDALNDECDQWQRKVAELWAERDTLRCCCKCIHSDHDMHRNWWCQFDPEPMNPNEYSTIEEHENCHFTPSRWSERGTE